MSKTNALLEETRQAARDESAAVDFFENRRWGAHPCCPRCGSVNVYKMTDATTGARNKDFRWRCRDEKKMYTVRTGTPLEESRLPLWVWAHCYWRAAASKKGVSALQIKRETGIAYNSALFVMDRIRSGMGSNDLQPTKLDGIVEADETYIGGKPRYHRTRAQGWTMDKAPVVGMVERGGKLRLRATKNVTARNADGILREHVSLDARLMTDEAPGYRILGEQFRGGHDTVCHKQKEYVRGDVTTNTIEGAFSLLKRGVYGTFHSLSRHKLPLYLSEFEFRYNTRKMDDAARAEAAIRAADGKRLTLADRRTRYRQTP